MPTYITLLRYTQDGMENIKDSPKRLKKAREAFQKAGGEMKAFYLTIGHYDAVAIIEAPSDAVYTATILSIASAGAVHTDTLKAFPEEEYRKVIAWLSLAHRYVAGLLSVSLVWSRTASSPSGGVRRVNSQRVSDRKLLVPP
jgi:uncharacterized protein with GYD domain